MLTRDAVVGILREQVEQAGSISAAARYLEVSDTLLGDVLSLRRPLSRKILDKMGLRRVVTYERVPLARRRSHR